MGFAKAHISAILRRFSQMPTVVKAQRTVESLLLTLLTTRSLRGRSDDVLILPSPGGFNTGDQAMLDSVLDNTFGKRIVLVNNRKSYRLGQRFDDVQVIELPGVYQPSSLNRLRHLVSYGLHVRKSGTVLVIGADVMDGVYNKPRSDALWLITRKAVHRNREVRVLGFSWSHEAVSGQAARRAVGAGVKPFLRDPVSFERFRSTCGAGTLAADVVFAGRAANQPRNTGGGSGFIKVKVVVLNVSGLVERSRPQVEEYVRVANYFSALGYSLLLLPHVTHPGADDRIPQNQLAVRLEECGVSFTSVNGLLSVEEECALLDEVELVITGRMHLGILSLSRGVPAFVFETQGKVQGLAQMFSEPRLAVQLNEPLSEAIISRIEAFGGDLTRLRLGIQESLPLVLDRSLLNFSKT